MVDTLRLSGKSGSFRFSATATKYYTFRNHDGEKDTIPMVQMDTNNDNYRVFYSPAYDRYDVEFNLAKVLFGNNWHNYALNPHDIGQLVRACARHFFGDTRVYLGRIDLGFVQQFADYTEAQNTLETFRKTRPKGIRKLKAKNQFYEHSIFFPSQNYSIKIYNKGAEQKVGRIGDADSWLWKVLRFEKTYRFREIERLGMLAKPFWGIDIDDMDYSVLTKDLHKIFDDWERLTNPCISKLSGLMGAVAAIDGLGKLNELEAAGILKRSTLSRYRARKYDDLLPDYTGKVKIVDSDFDGKLAQVVSAFIFAPQNFF